jgi:cytidylate kinase
MVDGKFTRGGETKVQERGETKVTNPPLITISRQLGSGGTEIAQELGNRLGWAVWDSKIINKIANDANVSREMVEHLDGRRISVFEEMARAIFSPTSTLRWETYLKHLVGVIMSIGQQGKAIIVGRGANFILPEALNVRIIASFDYRIETMMKRYDISQQEAESRIVRSDQEKEEFIKKVFGTDIDDAAFYDLIIKMDELGENATQVIRTAAQMNFKDLER